MTNYTYFSNQIEENDNLGYYLLDNKSIFFAQGPNNDTTAPIISFIQPSNNLTLITEKSYLIIANISDDNPPLYNNVTFQISNYTSFLFNATMNYIGGFQWSFNWDNISSYSNLDWYIIRVWAKDSSSNENYGWSGEYHIYINLTFEKSPGLFYTIIYFIVISVIFAAITIYLNKKGVFTATSEEKDI
jgi:hypothetical protein